MKKMIMTLAIAFGSLAAFAGEENVNPKVLNAFKTEFNTAKEVEWTAGSDFFKAAFTYYGKHVFAYYNQDGELLGLTRYISPVDLPLNLQTALKNKYANYWVSDLFEVAKDEGTSYYLTLENADTKIVVRASGDNGWVPFKKTGKS